MQRGNLVVEALAAFVETADLAAEAVGQKFGSQFGNILRLRGAQLLLAQIEQTVGIVMCGVQQQFERIIVNAHILIIGQGEYFIGKLL